MPAWRSSGALALCLALAACGTRDVETRPFAVEVARSDGAPLPPDTDIYVLAGTGHVAAPTTFVLGGVVFTEGEAPVDVTVRFRPDAAPEAALPPDLEGVPVTLVLFTNPAPTGPEGGPLPWWGFRLATGSADAALTRFLLFESAYQGEGTNTLPITLYEPTSELPLFRVVDDWAQFEPAECGPAYYDGLEVNVPDALFTLRRGERREVAFGPAGAPPWKVLHVLSWHRRGTCGSQAEAWTQLAAWR